MTRAGWTGALLAASLTLGGCGDAAEVAAPVSQIPSGAGVLNFDAYAVGSEQGRENSADLYGLRFNPLRVFRITTDKRISTMSASTEQVVVAAADEQIDQLGVVAPDGSIGPIPGLGRPHAFSPEVLANGTIRFEDREGSEENPERYLEWDPKAGKRSIVRTGQAATYGGFGSGPGERIFRTFGDRSGRREIQILGGAKKRTYPLPETSGAVSWGRSLIVITTLAQTNATYPQPVAMILLDPASGKRTAVDGWSRFSWSPDGRTLLVVRTGGGPGTPTELGVLDETSPTVVRSIGTIGYLGIYGGSWVRGTPATR